MHVHFSVMKTPRRYNCIRYLYSEESRFGAASVHLVMDSAVLEELLAKYQELRATEGRSAKLDARIEALDRERERYRIHGFGVDATF